MRRCYIHGIRTIQENIKYYWLPPFEKCTFWASLMLQRLRVHLPVQGTRVWSLIQEGTTCRETTSPCFTTSEPASHSYWAQEAQLLKPVHQSLCSRREATPTRNPCVGQPRVVPCSPQPEKLHIAMKTQHSHKENKIIFKDLKTKQNWDLQSSPKFPEVTQAQNGETPGACGPEFPSHLHSPHWVIFRRVLMLFLPLQTLVLGLLVGALLAGSAVSATRTVSLPKACLLFSHHSAVWPPADMCA